MFSFIFRRVIRIGKKQEVTALAVFGAILSVAWYSAQLMHWLQNGFDVSGWSPFAPYIGLALSILLLGVVRTTEQTEHWYFTLLGVLGIAFNLVLLNAFWGLV